MERARHVLAGRQVAGGLATVRRVDHREERGRDVHPVDAAHPSGGGEADKVSGDAAADGGHEIAAPDACLRKGVPNPRDRFDGLRLLAGRKDHDRPSGDLGIERGDIRVDDDVAKLV